MYKKAKFDRSDRSCQFKFLSKTIKFCQFQAMKFITPNKYEEIVLQFGKKKIKKVFPFVNFNIYEKVGKYLNKTLCFYRID